MIAIFRDEIGEKTYTNIINIQYYKGFWSIMFDDYETEEISAELIEISENNL